MDSSYLGPLALVVLFGIIGVLISVRFRVPSVLGLLVAGMVCGPFVLGIIDGGVGIRAENFELMQQIGEVGAILLLFTLGIEFSLAKLLKGGLRIFLVFIAKIAFVFGVIYVIMILFGLSGAEALFLGVILSITSTAFFARILTQQGFYKRKEVPLLVGVLILEDIYAVVALAFLSQITAAADFAVGWLLLRFVLGGLLLFGVYFVLTKTLGRVLRWMHTYHSDENIAFVSIALCFGMSALAGVLGLAPTAGAFLAGSAIAGMPSSKKFERSIHPFTLLFVSLFFLAMGMNVDPSALALHAPLILLLAGIVVFTHVIGIALPSYLFTGMGARNALFAGIAMIPVGEFSLLIAREAPAGGIDLVSITSGVLFLSVLVMGLFVSRSETIADAFSSRMPARLTSFMTYAAFRVSGALGLIEPGGSIHSEFARRRKVLLRDSLLFVSLGVVAFGYLFVVEPFVLGAIPQAILLRYVPLVLFGLMTLLVVKRIKDLLDIFSGALMTDSADISLERRAMRRATFGGLLLLLGFFIIPTIVRLLSFPVLYHALTIVPIALAILAFAACAHDVGRLYERSGRRVRFTKRIHSFRNDWKREVEIGYDEAINGFRKL